MACRASNEGFEGRLTVRAELTSTFHISQTLSRVDLPVAYRPPGGRRFGIAFARQFFVCQLSAGLCRRRGRSISFRPQSLDSPWLTENCEKIPQRIESQAMSAFHPL